MARTVHQQMALEQMSLAVFDLCHHGGNMERVEDALELVVDHWLGPYAERIKALEKELAAVKGLNNGQ